MIQRGEDLGFPLEPCEAVGVRGEGIWQDLESIVPLQRGVVRSPHLAHAALPKQGGHFIRADTRAGGESQM